MSFTVNNGYFAIKPASKYDTTWWYDIYIFNEKRERIGVIAIRSGGISEPNYALSNESKGFAYDQECEQNEERNKKIKEMAHEYFVINCEDENAIDQYYDNVNKNMLKKLNATVCNQETNKQFCKYYFFMLLTFIILTAYNIYF